MICVNMIDNMCAICGCFHWTQGQEIIDNEICNKTYWTLLWQFMIVRQCVWVFSWFLLSAFSILCSLFRSIQGKVLVSLEVNVLNMSYGGIFFRLCIFLQKPLKPKNITLRLNFEENSYFDAANEEFSNTSHKTTALILAVKSMTLNFIYGRFNFGWFLKFNTQVFYFNKKMNECLLSIVVQIFTQCMLQKWPRDHVR